MIKIKLGDGQKTKPLTINELKKKSEESNN